MTNIKEILEKEGPMLKLSNVAPEGFILVHEKTLEDLKKAKWYLERKILQLEESVSNGL